tara:strand:+ start:31 stop:510 length:480 start_codon:yes stop_codon:yes gene_type:complete
MLYICSYILAIPVQKKNKIKRIVLASDHAGFRLKEEIKKFLLKKRKNILDLGTKNTNSVDYPDYAHLLSRKIKNNNNQIGILVCGSGTGMVMTANKHKNIRAALCYNVKSTKLSREHNNANVIALGSRLTKKKVALKCINTFIKTSFKGGRHLRRINKI